MDREFVKTPEPRAGQCKRAKEPAILRDRLGVSNEVRSSRTNGRYGSVVGRSRNRSDNFLRQIGYLNLRLVGRGRSLWGCCVLLVAFEVLLRRAGFTDSSR